MKMQRKGPRQASADAGPLQAERCFQHGITLQQAGQLEQAATAYADAGRLMPSHAEALFRLAAVSEALGRPTDAINALQQAMHLRPDHAPGAIALAEALLHAGRTREAMLFLGPACARHTGTARLLLLNAHALMALGRTKAAVGALFMALDLQPGRAETHVSLAQAFYAEGDTQQALAHCVAAYELAPDHVNAAILGAILIELGRHADALVLLDHALTLHPGFSKALIDRAMALDGLLRHDEALVAATQAVAAAPEDPMAQHNLATLRLGAGHLTAQAWAGHEWRLRIRGNPDAPPSGAKWAGEDLSGRTIHLHAEQGLGDTLQFVRYAPLVAARGGRVTLAVQPPLVRLLGGTPGVSQLVAAGTPAQADFHSPLLSLPRLFSTTMNSIPPPLPYAHSFEPWDDGSTGLRVGLVWAGNATFIRDRQRSLPVAELARLAGVAGVQFYSLQQHKGAPPALPPELGAIDLMASVADFADTAALVAGLDLVVAVDTAVAHLAATMGKPVWLLSRFRGCWRWLDKGEDSPWYPSLRVLRQAAPGGWGAVIDQVRQDLTALAAQRDAA